MNALVVGATAGLGRALSRALAGRGHNMVLVARDHADLTAEANHLHTVYGARIETVAADAEAPESFVEDVSAATAAFGGVRAILFPIGMSRPDDNGATPLSQTRALVDVNFTSVAAVIEALLPQLLAQGDGVIVGFGSVAAGRGRGTNVVYAAAKRALESYFESLRYRLSAGQVRVQFYRLGYLDTQQSFGKLLLLPKAAPEITARDVAANLGRDLGIVTQPRFWLLVTPVVRMLPWWLFKRIKF